MSKLEALQPNASVRGILPDRLVTVVSVQWFGSEALELTYKDPTGRVANQLLYRHDEPRIEVVEQGRPWSFDGDGSLFRLVSEAHRIRLAHLFDPVLAVHTSLVEPLPHQITAVYEAMIPRQPLRFQLADDPGAGKTIMAGLFIKELIARGDLQRCLVVCPGSLAEQWQDELYRRFQLSFEILTNDKLEAARTGNWFIETNLVIARLDKLSRNEDVQQKLQAPDCRWDLVVCDEAHKMSATFFGGEIKYTKRYRLGQLLSTLTRHFLLSHEETLAAVEMAEALAASGMPSNTAIERLGGGWVAEEALAISIYCALVAADVREGVILAVNHDGDSDSTGAIAGNLLGAMHGVNAIPAEWLESLELRSVITEVAEDLFSFPDWQIGEYSDNRELNDRIWEKYPCF